MKTHRFTMMVLAALLGGAAACCAAEGEAPRDAAPAAPLWSLDFRDNAVVTRRDPAWTVSEDGRSVRSDGTPGTKTLRVAGLPDIPAGRFRLSFEAREFARSETAGHFGFSLDAADHSRFFAWAHPKAGFIARLSTADKVLREEKSGGTATFGRGDESGDPPWTPVTLEAGLHGWILRLGGAVAMSGERRIAAPASMTLHTRGVAVEMRDFRIEILPEPATQDAPRDPTFTAPGGESATIPLPASPLSEDAGAVMWRQRPGPLGAIRLLDADDREIAEFSILASQGARAQFTTRGGRKILFLRKITDLASRTDEEFRCAFSWGPDHRPRFFVNGLPFNAGGVIGEKMGERLDDVDFPAVRKVALSGGAARDVRLWRRTLPNAEIVRDWRRAMPLDIAMDEALIPAGAHGGAPSHVSSMPTKGSSNEALSPLQALPGTGTLSCVLAPGGTFLHPNPVAGATNLCAEVEVELTVQRRDDSVSSPLRWRTVDGGVSTQSLGRVAAPVVVRSAEVPLEPGLHRLLVRVQTKAADGTWGEPVARSLFATVWNPPDPLSAPATTEEIRLGPPFWERTFRAPGDMPLGSGRQRVVETAAGPCLSPGDASGDRMACEIAFPPEVLNRPCLLEIDWPDDAERSMGFYAYEQVPASVRDHLQAGIQAGGILLPTGRMQTARYLYWPNGTNVLFEVRTLAARRPAAVASLRVRPVEGGLPRLAVRRPQCAPPRRFGHADEDQTFDNNLTTQTTGTPTDKMLPVLAEYFLHTGQNLFSYSVMRYGWSVLARSEGSDRMSLFPRRRGELAPSIRYLRDAGIGFVAQIRAATDPLFPLLHLVQGDDGRDGWVLLDGAGENRSFMFRGPRQGNIANPAVRDHFLDQVEAVARETAGAGAVGVGFGVHDFIASFFAWPSLDMGYDDWTVARFAADTGVTLPATCADGAGPGRFAARHALLAQGALRERWLRWRADIVTQFVREAAERLAAAAPGVPLLFEVSGDESDYANRGIDLDALARIPNLRFGTMRKNTRYWFDLFRGMEEPDILDRLYDPADPALNRLLAAADGRLDWVWSTPEYFETFADSLKPKPYGNHFQNADAKPWGRWFLREPAFCLARTDMLGWAIGFQPIGTLGNEAEAREFARAYCALPALHFLDMGGEGDPVVGRFLSTQEGTYLYLVNASCALVEAAVRPAGEAAARGDALPALDLSSGGAIDLSAPVALAPYQLRSFLVEGRDVAFGPPDVRAAPEAGGLFTTRLAALDAALAALRAERIPCDDEASLLARARQRLSEGRLAEAHRLLFSRPLNALVRRHRQLDDVVAERRMNEEGRWAVNCGCTAFTRIDGALFSPDRTWDGGAYGHYGRKALTAARDTSGLPAGTPFAKLYESEEYDMDGYRFRLGAPGRYLVRLYLKVGWRRAFDTPGHWKVNIAANGAPLWTALDVAAGQEGDFDRPRTYEAEVEVGEDGLLDLAFAMAYPTADTTPRFCNAIEVLKR